MRAIMRGIPPNRHFRLADFGSSGSSCGPLPALCFRARLLTHINELLGRANAGGEAGEAGLK